VTTSPEVGAINAAETLRCELHETDLQLRPRFQQAGSGTHLSSRNDALCSPPPGRQGQLRHFLPTTGARGLRSIMEGILLDTMFDLPSLEGVEEVVISREVVEGTAQPLYIYGARVGDADASAS
jgi:hypothetical protein